MGQEEKKTNDEVDLFLPYSGSWSPEPNPNSGRWTFNLVFCCVIVCLSGSVEFGYNISSLNPVSTIIKEFIGNETFLFREFYEKQALFKLNEGYLQGNETRLQAARLDLENTKSRYIDCTFSFDYECQQEILNKSKQREEEIFQKYGFRMTVEEFIENRTAILNEKKKLLESKRPLLVEGEKKVLKFTAILWTVLNVLFVIGGCIGCVIGKYILDWMGRKKSLLFHNLFTLAGSILVFVSYYGRSPIALLLSRFLFGFQGALSCSLVPTYVNEISPAILRGRTGVFHQLFITSGILIAQCFGMRQLFGNLDCWHIQLAMPIVPALVASVVLLLLLPETPTALVVANKDVQAAKLSLQLLRNDIDVEHELAQICKESKMSKDAGHQANYSLKEVLTSAKLRWPLLTAAWLNAAQQFSGINAIFYYSADIFANSGIEPSNIQYAILSTGVVNLISTLVCIQLIDRVGRKPLLIVPLVVICIDFLILTTLLTLKTYSFIPLVSIICIIIFIVSFAIGLGPIPFIYAAEVVPQQARSTVMSITTLTNWFACVLLTLFFPLLNALINQFVFLVFAGAMAFTLFVVLTKVPETKGKKIEDILESF